jgi:hypothetical protein
MKQGALNVSVATRRGCMQWCFTVHSPMHASPVLKKRRHDLKVATFGSQKKRSLAILNDCLLFGASGEQSAHCSVLATVSSVHERRPPISI